MKKEIGIILGVMFLLFGVGFVLGAVVINEVEINPAGADPGFEWIELYNDGGADVNLTGWYVMDDDNDNHTIPNVIIGAGGYYVFDSLNWLSPNTDHNLTLFNDLDVSQNTASSLTDNNNNDNTWQRIPNGVGAFSFLSMTKGAVNEDSVRNVPSEYATIQAAIDAADEGDIVNISAGGSPYVEDLDINKGVSLVGAGSGFVTIVGSHTITDSDVSITEVTFETSGTTITIDSSGSVIDDITITNCVFDLTNGPSVGIYVGGGTPTNAVTDLVMDNNVFNGPSSGPYEKVCNPWKIGGSFAGGGLNAEVDDIDFTNNEVNWCSIPLNLQDGDLKNILIDNNIFRNTDGVVYVWGETASNPSGKLSGFVFTNNDVDLTNSYGVGIDVVIVTGIVFDDDNFGNGNRVNNNNFEGVVGAYGFGAVSILSALTTYVLDAEENWWGACSGPGGAGSGSGSNVSTNVDYTPWIGVCISNKTNYTCAFESEDAEISADLVGDGILDVWFSYTMAGVNYNKTGVLGTGNSYSYDIPKSELVSGTVFWNVYANDTYGREYSNGLKSFYVRDNTELVVDPVGADGLNGWYVSEPLFSLLGDGLLVSNYYQWEAEDELLYTAPFRLEDIPNQPNVTAGTLKLSWWSEFVCGNESKLFDMLYIDLTDPVIDDLSPVNGSLVVEGTPEISAYLDDVYQSNSGINLTSVVIEVDGGAVPGIVVNADTLDAIVSYTPVTELDDGMHDVRVYVEDNAGRSSELMWSFEVNKSLAGFDLNVSSPLNGNYESRKVAFEIRTDKEVEIIEYINHNDRRPRWRRLCRGCDEFGVNRVRTKNMKEGENNITIRAVDSIGNIEEINVLVFVDSKKPRISKILPKRRAFTNGSNFYVKYTEDNLQQVVFSFNPDHVVSSCTDSGKNIECWFDYDLSLYDGEVIEYSIKLTDLIRSVESKTIGVTVDMTAPEVLNPDDFWEQGLGRKNKYIYFYLEVDEDNLDEVNYIDYEASRPRWRRLCSRLRDGVCEKRKSFRKGWHDVDVQILDEAGNSVVVSVGEFEVV